MERLLCLQIESRQTDVVVSSGLAFGIGIYSGIVEAGLVLAFNDMPPHRILKCPIARCLSFLLATRHLWGARLLHKELQSRVPLRVDTDNL